jgi:hypothetical protein
MRKAALPVMLLLVVAASAGCSQNKPKWTPEDIQKYTPVVESMCQTLTTQALKDQLPWVKETVNKLTPEVASVLEGKFDLSADDVDALIALAIKTSKINLSMESPVVGIMRTVILVGIQSAEDQINKVGGDISNKNKIVIEFVQAALRGIEKGSRTH